MTSSGIAGQTTPTATSVNLPQGRFEYEQELTFAPKLNATSIRLAQERRGLLRARASRLRSSEASDDEFTFRPQMSSASLKIAQGLGTTFMARQELHLKKQKQLLEQQAKLPLKLGKLSPVAKGRKFKERENSDIAWHTPISTPNLNEKDPVLDGSASRLGVGTSLSMLNPVKHTRGAPTFHSAINLQRIGTDAPNIYHQSSFILGSKRQPLPKTKPKHQPSRRLTHPVPGDAKEGSDEETDAVDPPMGIPRQRSQTAGPTEVSPRYKVKGKAAPTGERLRVAKITAERAIKSKRIFMIHGPYPVVRECLREREWVEKQYRTMAPHKMKKKTAESDDDDSDASDDSDADANDDTGCQGDSDEEDDEEIGDSDSVCGIMSRIVRNTTPNFIWTCRNSSIDFKFLRKDQIVNHFAKNGAFTTKSGLCSHLRNLPWYDHVDPSSFFPRCFKICSEDEKMAFLEDYRLGAACAILKWVVMKHNGELDVTQDTSDTTNNSPGRASKMKKKPPEVISSRVIDQAIAIVEEFFHRKEHEDIDEPFQRGPLLTENQWEEFIKQYYLLIHDGGNVEDSMSSFAYCDSLVNRLRSYLPQLDLDGLRNIWIVKPGAKSRGRGIFCLNKLDELLKLVGNPLVIKEGKWVVQKYIERPLLVYNTKFDIRQWFLVTDWNPLTVWFYQSCYLRFCTQPFSLEDFDASIHLSNQSIQKNYENSKARSGLLPEENMWTSAEFQDYLNERGCGNVWQDVIYPGMKKSVVCALQCCQDVVAARKNSFELYGADFMLTDDFKPWLIEINCSPAMGATSKVTEKMCAQVIEDTMTVILDRRHDKNCDTGCFELAYKQHSVHVPSYVGVNLAVEGSAIRKPIEHIKRQKSTTNIVPRVAEISPRKEKAKLPKKSNSGQEIIETQAAPPSLEEMQRKFAGLPLDGSWGQACLHCGRGNNIKTSNHKPCFCQKDSVMAPSPAPPSCAPTPYQYPSLIQTNSDTKLAIHHPMHRPHTVSGAVSPDLIPRSGAFYSDRHGKLITISGHDLSKSISKSKVKGFPKGKTKPNVNRQHREKLALMKSTRVSPGKSGLPLAVTNSFR